MAHFLHVLDRRQEIFEDLNEQLRDRNKWIDAEVRAATMVQTKFRSGRMHHMFCIRRAMARKIQRLIRGHFARDRCKEKIEATEEWQDRLIFDYYAEQVQKIWRGHHSRRYVHDFWARKRYIKTVLEKGNELKLKLKDYAAQRAAYEEAETSKRQKAEFTKVTQNLHHLLSTESIPGIYNNPYFNESKPTVAGQSVEEHLRGAIKGYLKTHNLTRKKFKQTKRDRRSVQASSSYDIERERRSMDLKLHKLKQISNKSFSASGRSRLFDKFSAHRRVKPLNVGEPYLEPSKIFQSTKELQERNKDARVSNKPFYCTVSSNTYFDD